ncbi:MAG: polymer-forming cytoskeletal protein [Candidatus Zixiibacteriota bacterium]
MRKTISFPLIISYLSLYFLAWVTIVHAQSTSQDNKFAPSDTVFNEIILTDEGVTAFDIDGFEWHYDFFEGQFVYGKSERQAGYAKFVESGDVNADFFPIEERCTVERRLKPSVRSILIGYDEFVDGDIIAYGRVTIKGWVKGNVKSFNKRVFVARTGRVDGNVEAPEITVREGGLVLGKQIISSSPIKFQDFTSSFSLDGVIVVASFTAFFLFLGFLMITLMPRKLETFHSCFYQYKLKTYFLGFFTILMIFVIGLFLTITIVGIVLLPMIPFIYLFAMIMGIISFGNLIGRTVLKRIAGGEKTVMFQSLIGILVLMTLWFVVAILLGANDTVSNGFGIFFLVVAIIISTYPILSGVGAAILTRFGFKLYTGTKIMKQPPKSSAVPAPPPMPESPSVSSADDYSDHADET